MRSNEAMSSPAQKALPRPEITTARTLMSPRSASPASMSASNIAGSSAFILSARASCSSTTPSAWRIDSMRSFMRVSMGWGGGSIARRGARR
jgi:hypothetical protein